MKKYLAFSLLFSLFAISANAACEGEASSFVANRFGLATIDVRDLGTGSESGQDREVWVKAANGSTYSIFFGNFGCSNITRYIAW